MRREHLAFLFILLSIAGTTFITVPAHANQYHLEIHIDKYLIYEAMNADPSRGDKLLVNHATLTVPWSRILSPDRIEYSDDGITISFTYVEQDSPDSVLPQGANVFPVATVTLTDYALKKQVTLVIRSTSILAAKMASNINNATLVWNAVKDAINELSENQLKALEVGTVKIDRNLLAILKYRNDVIVRDITIGQPSLEFLSQVDGDLGWHVICDGGVVVEHAVDTSHPDAGTPMPGWWSGRVLTGDPEVEYDSWRHFRDYLLAGVYRFEKGSSWATAITCIVEKAFNTYPGYPGGMVSQLPMDSFLATFTSAYAPADWLDYSQNATGNNDDPIVIPMLVPLLNYTVVNNVDTYDSETFMFITVNIFTHIARTGLSGFFYDFIPLFTSEWDVNFTIAYSKRNDLSDSTKYYLVPSLALIDKDVLLVKWHIWEDNQYYYVRPIPLITPKHMITLLPVSLSVNDTYTPPFPFYTKANAPSTTSFTIGKADYPGDIVDMVYIDVRNTVSPPLDFELFSFGSPILNLMPDILSREGPGFAIRIAAELLSGLMYVNAGSQEEAIVAMFILSTAHRPDVNSYCVTVNNMVPYKVSETGEFINWMHWGGIKVSVRYVHDGDPPGCGPTQCPIGSS